MNIGNPTIYCNIIERSLVLNYSKERFSKGIVWAHVQRAVGRVWTLTSRYCARSCRVITLRFLKVLFSIYYIETSCQMRKMLYRKRKNLKFMTNWKSESVGPYLYTCTRLFFFKNTFIVISLTVYAHLLLTPTQKSL